MRIPLVQHVAQHHEGLIFMMPQLSILSRTTV